MKNFNKAIADKMIQKAKNNFYKSPTPNDWKAKLKELKIIIKLNPRFTSTAGMMIFDDYYSGMPFDNISTFNGNLGKWTIILNPKNIIRDPYKEVFQVVSHELAHALDFIVNKNAQRNFHNPIWKYIHKAMGGDGERYCKFYFPSYNNPTQLQKLLKDFPHD